MFLIKVFQKLPFKSIVRARKQAAAMSSTTTKFLNQADATSLDVELFNVYHFSVDQLMELAGLSVAIAIAQVYPPSFERKPLMPCNLVRDNRVLVICGPGNNGGDGLVAARHLSLFGFEPAIFYPKRTSKPLYDNLLIQCEKYGIPILDSCPDQETMDKDYNLVVDALFGFSFRPPVRENMKPILNAMINTTLPVCSVDIPSGWDVEEGPPSEAHITPKLLISLSAPKLCAKYLKDSRHFLGGRFIPPDMQEKYGLTLPNYPGTEQVVELCG